MLKVQRNPRIKFGIGFDEEETSNQPKSEINPILEDNKGKQQVNTNHYKNKQKASDGFTNVAYQRRFPKGLASGYYQSNRSFYPYLNNIYAFYGYYYKCNNFGYKVASYRFRNQSLNFVHKSAFASLLEYDVKCYKCHNLGHITKFCKIRTSREEKKQTTEENSFLNKNNNEVKTQAQEGMERKECQCQSILNCANCIERSKQT